GNRTAFDPEAGRKIKEAAEAIPGIFGYIESDPQHVQAIADVVGRAEKLRFLNPQAHYEFFKDEMRWNDKEVFETRNGLDIRTLELSNTQVSGLEVSRDPEVMEYVRRWKGG